MLATLTCAVSCLPAPPVCPCCPCRAPLLPLPCSLPAPQTWLLFVLLSVVSMAMGFYDLWKNVPYFKQFVVGMFRPAAAVFEWLEGHTQVGC